LRANAVTSLLALACCFALAWLGLSGFAWTDYEVEAQASLEALVHGHVAEFLRLAPAYGGSLIERAPFALLPGLWGGGSLAVYRAVAVPCLLASAALGVWLVAGMRARGASRLARATALGICVANPLTLKALEIGHPEDVLGGSICVAAVALACRLGDRRRGALLAGALVGLAVANKEWALLAAGPTLLALPPGRQRRLALLGCAFAAGVVLAPLLLVSGGGFAAGTKAAASTTSQIFQPWQVWWFLGHHGVVVHGLFGSAKPGYRTAPSWIGAISHPAVLAFGVALALALWPRARRAALPEREALLALALVLLARCMLDTWDISYYVVPFLFALLAWETRRPRVVPSPPLLALGCTVLSWLSFVWGPEHWDADVQAAAFLAWTVPLALVLAVRLLHAPPKWRPELRQETTVRALDSLVSTS
jgi:hypothetical protein